MKSGYYLVSTFRLDNQFLEIIRGNMPNVHTDLGLFDALHDTLHRLTGGTAKMMLQFAMKIDRSATVEFDGTVLRISRYQPLVTMLVHIIGLQQTLTINLSQHNVVTIVFQHLLYHKQVAGHNADAYHRGSFCTRTKHIAHPDNLVRHHHKDRRNIATTNRIATRHRHVVERYWRIEHQTL